MKTLLSGYLLSSQGDRMSLAHGVEGRYPFLDHRVVESLFYYNDNYKLSGFSQKYILGKAFANILPETIVNRPKKPYTAPDLKAFFNGGTLSEKTSFFLSKDTIDDYGIFDKDYVNRFVCKFSDKTPNEIGYRDNMLVTFILSCQMTKYWAMNPKSNILKDDKMTVKIIDC
jgi:asparagine synthase (glutamine-hydrolysing)